MIPIVGAFRGLFLGGVLLWYSTTVWKTMDGYYNREFKKYLEKEKQERRIPLEPDVCPADETLCGEAVRAATSSPPPAPPSSAPAPVPHPPHADGFPENGDLHRDAGDEEMACAGVGGGGTEVRDATHSGEWRPGEKEGDGDADDTCPVRP